MTENKPSLAEVAAILKLDPAHDTLRAEPEDRGLTVWKRSFAGIPVLDDVKVVKQLGKWRTRFHVVDTAPEPVRHDALLSEAAAVAASGVKDGVAELRYAPVFVQHQVAGSPGDNAYDYDLRVQRFELIYRVTPADRPVPAADIDAYSGKVLRSNTGIIVN